MMALSDEHKKTYHQQGFLYLPNIFSELEVKSLKGETDRIFTLSSDSHLIAESGEFLGTTAMDRVSPLYKRLLIDERLLGVAHDLLEGPLYCHQYKVIIKRPFSNSSLPWHQDFGPWHHYDGMPEPKAISMGVYLDPVTNFNGPITCISKSHMSGLLNYEIKDVPGTTPIPSLSEETVGALTKSGELVAPTGGFGSVLIFDCCTAHASGLNISPFPRDLIYISYNQTDNALRKPTRPDHFASRNFEPLKLRGGDDNSFVSDGLK